MRRPRPALALAAAPVVLALAAEAVAPAAGSPAADTVRDGRAERAAPAAPPGPAVVPPESIALRSTPGGTRVVRGRGVVHGYAGPVVRYTVEVHGSLRNPSRRAAELFATVERAFGDLDRGWASTGARRMLRVSRAPQADVRIVLARPTWVNRVCARKGMRTAGRFSCWTGRYAALNLRRWRHGSEARGFRTLGQYRLYLVNHEVGHGLGYAHRTCPRRGARAHVMLPQSRSLFGCRANGWPHR